RVHHPAADAAGSPTLTRDQHYQFGPAASSRGTPDAHSGQSAGTHKLFGRRARHSSGTRCSAAKAGAASPRTSSAPTATGLAPQVAVVAGLEPEVPRPRGQQIEEFVPQWIASHDLRPAGPQPLALPGAGPVVLADQGPEGDPGHAGRDRRGHADDAPEGARVL